MDNEFKISFDSFMFVVRKRWLIVCVIGILVATIVYIGCGFLITPKYSSYAKLYVNNTTKSTQTTSGQSLTQSDLYVAQSLVETYIVIIESDSNLEKVAQVSGIDYTPDQIRSGLYAESISGTEAFGIKVSDPDPNVAYKLASAIVDVAPETILNVVEAGSVRVIDSPKVAEKADNTYITVYAIIGFLFAALLTFVCYFVSEVTDVTIYAEEDLSNSFSKYPVIGVIPRISSGSDEKIKGRRKKQIKEGGYYGGY